MNNTVFTDPKLLEELNKYGRVKTVPQGTVLIEPGQEIFFIPLVQQGVLRIVRQNDEGKEAKPELWLSTAARAIKKVW